ncbi:hypothetical protein B188_06160 [Candidatus Brocadiaceae bacterium B188]|nr:hypothetical protein B188_06160 [Candidatus Brocadiaceae bacterium B188]
MQVSLRGRQPEATSSAWIASLAITTFFLCLLISFSCAIDTLFLLDFRLYENDSVV